MPRKLHISVPAPCTQKWDEMSFVDEQQRHCLSCNKFIFDFTKMSDAELIAYFNRNTVSCGKFAPHQLNRTIRPPQKASRGWMSALLFPALLSFTELNAQEPVPAVATHQTDTASVKLKLPIESTATHNDTTVFNGTVLRMVDSVREVSVAGAVLNFRLTPTESYQCVSDTTGKFEIRIPTRYVGDVVGVTVSMTGYPVVDTTVLLMQHVSLNSVTVIEKTYNERHVVGELPVLHQPSHTIGSRTRRLFWILFHPRHWFHRHKTD